jgi:hypothetical protein
MRGLLHGTLTKRKMRVRTNSVNGRRTAENGSASQILKSRFGKMGAQGARSMAKKKIVKHPAPWKCSVDMDGRGSVLGRIYDAEGHFVVAVQDDWPEDTEKLAKRICAAINKAESRKDTEHE